MPVSSKEKKTKTVNQKETTSKIFYQIRIELDDILPSIYRTILVDSSITFTKLHNLIQQSFELENYHMWNFSYEKKIQLLGRKTRAGIIEIAPKCKEAWDEPEYYADKTKISEILTEEKQKINYCYDFGDDWRFTVKLEKIIFSDKLDLEINPKNIPLMLKAQGPMLLEDIGGNWGFSEILILYTNLSNGFKIPKEDKEINHDAMCRVVGWDYKNPQNKFIKAIEKLFEKEGEAIAFKK